MLVSLPYIISRSKILIRYFFMVPQPVWLPPLFRFVQVNIFRILRGISVIPTRVRYRLTRFLSVFSVAASRRRLNFNVQKFSKSLFSFYRDVHVFDKANFTCCWIKPRNADPTSGRVRVLQARRLQSAQAVLPVRRSPQHRVSFFLYLFLYFIFVCRVVSCCVQFLWEL